MVGAALLLVVLILGLGLVWLRQAPRPPTAWTLPDGTQLRWAGLTVGTNHPSPLKYPWERWPLPVWLLSALPTAGWPKDYPGAFPELRIWFHTDRRLPLLPSYRWDLIDESGFSIANFSALQLTTTQGASAIRLDYGLLARPGETLRLVVRDPHPKAKMEPPALELSIPNPRKRSAVPPSSESADLPQSAPVGPWQFTLASFETGVNRHQRTFATAAEDSTAWLTFLAASNGVPNRDWLPQRIQVMDETGVYLETSLEGWQRTRNGWLVKLIPGPPTGQRWRLRVEFSHNEGFAPEELVTFRGIRRKGLPIVPLDLQQTLGKQVVHLKSLKLLNPAENSWRAEVALIGREQGQYVTLVSVQDHTGYAQWHEPRNLQFRARPDLETLDLTFAVHRGLWTEFVAEPVDLRKP